MYRLTIQISSLSPVALSGIYQGNIRYIIGHSIAENASKEAFKGYLKL
jgi:hypothetical protein